VKLRDALWRATVGVAGGVQCRFDGEPAVGARRREMFSQNRFELPSEERPSGVIGGPWELVRGA